jgi:hypothetical protein
MHGGSLDALPCRHLPAQSMSSTAVGLHCLPFLARMIHSSSVPGLTFGADAGCAGEETAGEVPDVAQSARLPTAVDSQPAPRSAPIAAASSAPLRVRVASATAVEAKHPSAAQGSRIARQQLASLDSSKGADTAAALAAAAAEAEVCEQKPLHRMNTGAAINRPAAQGQPETEMGPLAIDWAQGSARGAAQGVPAAENVSQSAGGPAPWPMHLVKLQGSCTARVHAGVHALSLSITFCNKCLCAFLFMTQSFQSPHASWPLFAESCTLPSMHVQVMVNT